tara:strand:+ start:104 stop:1291 length:1188 start_codon:yes stop_codon:yes gene_type:complete
MKVLHILYQSLPNISGSSIRSRDIINNQLKIGIEPIVITSPFQKPFEEDMVEEINNGVKYYRTFSNENEVVKEKLTDFTTQIKKMLRIFYFTFKLIKIAKKENISVLHAHAMFYCAIPAKVASIVLKKPMIYEIRSLWEERYKTGNFIVKCLFELITFLETLSMFLSDEIIVINQNLKENLKNRLLLRYKKIRVVPNAVDLSNINIVKSSKRRLTFSYIGTISPIEGLDLLIHAFNNLYNKGFKNRLLIFGDGLEKKNLTKIAKNNPLIEFKGQFYQSDIADIYSEVDVIVNPRKKSYLTDSVTPLKPLEAMAYKKLIIASDVGGMKELIENGENGILFESGSVYELEKVISKISKNNDWENIVENAYSHIVKNRSWFENAKLYNKFYCELIDGK